MKTSADSHALSGRLTELWLPLAALSALALWMAIKIWLFQGWEYGSDLLVHTQKSKSFIYGYPILYDHFHGAKPYHNYFIELLFFPVTIPFGSYGLFLPTFLFYALALRELCRLADSSGGERRALYIVAIVPFFLGPIGFYMFDNRIYGWYPEMLTFPLAALFTTALIQGRRRAYLFWAGLLLMVHSNSAVLMWSLHSLYTLFVTYRVGSGQPLQAARLGWSLLRIGAAWSTFFFCSLLLQRSWDPAGAERLSNSLQVNVLQPDVMSSLLAMCGQLSVVLFAGAFLLYLAGLDRRGLVRAGLAALFVLPLFVPGILASFPYGLYPSEIYENALWPARLAFTWSAAFCGALINISDHAERSCRRGFLIGLPAVIALSIALQSYALGVYRDYYPLQRIWAAMSGDLNSSKYSAVESALVACLADALPRDLPIIPSFVFWSRFHAHNIDQYNQGNPYRSFPEVSICDLRGRIPYEGGCFRAQELHRSDRRFKTVTVEGIEVSFQRKLKGYLRQCLPQSQLVS